MIRLHKENHVFGWGEFRWQDAGNDAVAAYWRTLSERTILIVNNLSPDSQKIRLRIHEWCASIPVDLLSGQKMGKVEEGDLVLKLQPFQFLWLNIRKI
ncbi:alpha-glucosidase C-terminal domain-containing protein [Chloroflexota bacterium]